MPPEEYRAKCATSARRPSRRRGRQAHSRPIFVVQEHHASHAALRLPPGGRRRAQELGGAQGAVARPGDKRLAVRVEDHPLAYADFTATSPQGQYGAGHVEIWDHGTYDACWRTAGRRPSPAGIEAGRLEFALHGERLNGRFTLVRMRGGKGGGKENWLLIKRKDDARPRRRRGEGAGHAAVTPRRRPPRAAKAGARSRRARPAGKRRSPTPTR